MGSETNSRRGRPKGSGIDDTATLAQIAGMLSADASLKPTTAIRTLGIDDPSTIRRLRDKLKGTLPLPGHAPAEAQVREFSNRAPRTMAAAVANDDGVIREAPRLRVVSSTPEDRSRSSEGPSSPVAAASAVAPLLALWIDAGFRAASMALEAQQSMMTHWAGTPLVASMIRQQIALNDLAVAHLAPASPRARTKP